MTSCHYVTKPDLPISACRCARDLILFLFPWFFRSLSSKMPLTFYFGDSVTSWRHVMTSLNLIHLSQLVEELESSFFFLFTWFCGSLSSKRLMIFHSYDFVTSWRHVMTSQKLFNLFLRLWIHWKDDRVQDSTVFLVAHSRNVSVHVFVGWYLVMTSRHDVTSILNITLQYLLIL